ncbi:MAG: hypothetical protein LC790_13635 [Actinobacteria bacterium]|nr:hypothetical protein [Actinomycetota bacterium]
MSALAAHIASPGRARAVVGRLERHPMLRGVLGVLIFVSAAARLQLQAIRPASSLVVRPDVRVARLHDRSGVEPGRIRWLLAKRDGWLRALR